MKLVDYALSRRCKIMSNHSRSNQKNVIDKISITDYVRQRKFPEYRDLFYLSLSDIRLALEDFRNLERVSVLDYGSGGSPYADLFPNSEYLRADIPTEENLGRLDYRISEKGCLDVPSNSIDIILTTQVVEHVENPDYFFSNCFRILRPGGLLICTTHGFWEEHACPNDFQRWTSFGLIRDVTKAGFDSIVCRKLTTGPRALLSLLICHGEILYAGKATLLGWFCFSLRNITRLLRSALHRIADEKFKDFRVVSADSPRETLYIGLLVSARKPSGNTSQLAPSSNRDAEV